MYDKTARNSMDALYFARAGESQDTWVPLVEKAFAKLYGDYASIMGGRVSESLEDITGCALPTCLGSLCSCGPSRGVATSILTIVRCHIALSMLQS